MKHCYIVLREPGREFLGIHLTIDGAVHAAAGLGANGMPNGDALYVDSVSAWFKRHHTISLRCADGEDHHGITIERHVVVL